MGNAAYPTAPLRNAVNDALDMTIALRDLGFEVVTGTNLTRGQMVEALRQFALAADGALRAKDLAAWKQSIAERWSELGFVAVNISVPSPGRLAPGEAFDVEAHVRLGTIEPEELAVDWFEGRLDPEGVVPTGYSTPFTFIERNDGHAVYRAHVVRPAEDRGYSVRIRPTHRDLAFPNETGLVVWAG